ncbi:class I SAM-dependent methyltransferase [Amycolatopsis palatopharyngis]|uniref:class I SAM-dependent methyltransferase n=1 Tax=Amycolatopsis palatopharyngis TaxID=187982 RepID=UPI000E245EBD|nr:class I SAM-dependent methyltransferase [Amycolatopsis palatopharyngis]
MNDEYAESAEYIDILISPFWNDLGPALAAAIKDVDPSDGPIIDIGAGSGCGTTVIARYLPKAEIVAVEPSPGLRSALLAKVSADAALRRRVTVLPERFLEADLPDRLSLAVAMNVIGHFSPPERHRIWGLLAERLAPNGRVVLNLQPPSEPIAVPDTVSSTVDVGRRRYEGSARAEPTGDRTLTWYMTYRTYQGHDLVDERRASYTWHLLTERQLRDELAQANLQLRHLEPADLGMCVITRAKTQR